MKPPEPSVEFAASPVLDFDSLPATTTSTTRLPAGQELGVTAQRLTRRPTRRRALDMRSQADAARRLVRPLPKPGESVHALLDGSFVLAATIPAVLDELGQPAALTVSTLGLNDATVDLLCSELESGRLTKCSLILSHYFQQADKEQCQRAVDRLRQHKQRVAVCRCHAKLMLFAPVKSRDRFTVETSANLRSAVCLEQAVITNDPRLYQFHERWTTAVLQHSQAV